MKIYKIYKVPITLILFLLLLIVIIFSSTRADAFLVLPEFSSKTEGSISSVRSRGFSHSRIRIIIEYFDEHNIMSEAHEIDRHFYQFDYVGHGESTKYKWSQKEKKIWPYLMIYTKISAENSEIITIEKFLTF